MLDSLATPLLDAAQEAGNVPLEEFPKILRELATVTPARIYALLEHSNTAAVTQIIDDYRHKLYWFAMETGSSSGIHELEYIRNQGGFIEWLIELDTNNVHWYVHHFNLNIHILEDEEIHELIKQAEEIDPNNSYVWYIKGVMHARNEEDNRAEQCFKKSFYINPYNTDAMLGYTMCTDNKDEILEHLETMIFLEDRDFFVATYIIFALHLPIEEIKKRKIGNIINNAIIRNPKHIKIQALQARYYKVMQQFTLAAEKYTELKAAIKDDHEELVHAAEACLQTFEHNEEALEFSTKAFEQIQDEETYILHIKCLRRNNYLEAAHAISHQGKLRFPVNQVLEKLYCSTYIQLDDTNAIASILNAIAKNIPEDLEDMDI